MRRSWSVTHIHVPHGDQGSDYNRHDGDGQDGGSNVTTGDGSVKAVSVTADTPAVLHLRSELSITMSSVVLSSNENAG